MNKTRRFKPLLCALLATGAISPAIAKPSLHGIFTDHAVIQRDRPIAIWGQATAAEKLTVSLSDAAIDVIADSEGNWRATLPVMPAGGPYTLSVTNKAGEAQQVNDIMIGDVFLCSGQSNMAMTVKESMNAGSEISAANNPSIRTFNVALVSKPSPQTQLPSSGEWKTAVPANVGDFSATCYYYARQLQPHINAPIGLINASWGGSAIESWIGADEMAAMGRGSDVAILKSYTENEATAQMQFVKGWESWWARSFAGAGRPWVDKPDDGWTALPLPMRDWKQWGDADLAQHNGMLWFRKSFTLTPEQAKQAATLHLGAMDEIDTTWVNGQPVAQTFGWSTNRDYALPANMLRVGKNEIVTNIYSAWGMGGMFGPPEAIRLELPGGHNLPLGDGWMFKKVPKGADDPPRAPWLAMGGLTTIGNAMIAPLAPYGLRGALWYQGESNTGRAHEYQSMLAALMRDWRKKFAAPDLPVMIVQLPNFGEPISTPTASGWSNLREAQRLAVQNDKAAGLAVIIDSGEDDDIHPPNKQVVGTRLARLARNLIYKQPVTANGPVALSAVRVADKIAVSFGGFDRQLVAHSSSSPIAFEACGADQASCRFVAAAIEGGKILLKVGDASTVQRIRYCWGDSPRCNLYDAAGLPAGPFELAVGK